MEIKFEKKKIDEEITKVADFMITNKNKFNNKNMRREK